MHWKVLESKLQLQNMEEPGLVSWDTLCATADAVAAQPDSSALNIAIVGKYTLHGNEAYKSIVKSLTHSTIKARVKVRLVWIEASDLLDPKTGARAGGGGGGGKSAAAAAAPPGSTPNAKPAHGHHHPPPAGVPTSGTGQESFAVQPLGGQGSPKMKASKARSAAAAQMAAAQLEPLSGGTAASAAAAAALRALGEKEERHRQAWASLKVTRYCLPSTVCPQLTLPEEC